MAVSEKEVREFAKRVKGLQRSAGELSNDVRAHVTSIVDEHRRKIKELIDHYPPKTTLPAGDIPRLSAQIKAEVDSMIDEAAMEIRKAQEGVWRKGVAAGQELAQGLELEGAFFAPSAELLTIATGYTADLVRTIGTDLMPQVNGVLSRAVLGSKTPHEAMQDLDALLGRAGQRGVSWQAERIVRTEVQRVYDIALDQQVQSLTSMLDNPKGLKKEWVSGPWRPGRREEHQRMDGEQVPVDEPFTLKSGVRLDYPRALGPDNAPEETICCGCTWRIVPESLVDSMT